MTKAINTSILVFFVLLANFFPTDTTTPTSSAKLSSPLAISNTRLRHPNILPLHNNYPLFLLRPARSPKRRWWNRGVDAKPKAQPRSKNGKLAGQDADENLIVAKRPPINPEHQSLDAGDFAVPSPKNGRKLAANQNDAPNDHIAAANNNKNSADADGMTSNLRYALHSLGLDGWMKRTKRSADGKQHIDPKEVNPFITKHPKKFQTSKDNAAIAKEAAPPNKVPDKNAAILKPEERKPPASKSKNNVAPFAAPGPTGGEAVDRE